MRKKSKNWVFFDFRKVYRPAEISGWKKNFPKIGQNVYFEAHKILKTYAQNLVKIWRFVRGGKKALPPPTSLKGIIRKIVLKRCKKFSKFFSMNSAVNNFRKFFTAKFIEKKIAKFFTVNFIEKKIRHFFQKIRRKKSFATLKEKESHRRRTNPT